MSVAMIVMDTKKNQCGQNTDGSDSQKNMGKVTGMGQINEKE